MGDGRWEMGDGRWEMGDGRWEMKEHGMFMRTDKEENTEIGDSPGKIAWHGGSAG